MKIVLAGLWMAALAVISVPIAHADPFYSCDGLTGEALRQCIIKGEQPLPSQASNEGKPVCQWASPNGDVSACTSCTGAISTQSLAQQVYFDCGMPGAANPTGKRPHCMVGTIHTRQPNCYGDLHADGSVTESN